MRAASTSRVLAFRFRHQRRSERCARGAARGHSDRRRPGRIGVASRRQRSTVEAQPSSAPRYRAVDKTSGSGYQIRPSAMDGTADNHGVADMWVLRYNGQEIDDGVSIVGGPVPPRRHRRKSRDSSVVNRWTVKTSLCGTRGISYTPSTIRIQARATSSGRPGTASLVILGGVLPLGL